MYALVRAFIRLITLVVSVILGVNFIAFTISNLSNMDDFDITPTIIISIVLFAGLGILLGFIWMKTDNVVQFIIDEPVNDEIEIKTTNKNLMGVFLWGFGLYLLITTIPNLLAAIVGNIQYADTFNNFGDNPYIDDYVAYGLKIIAAYVLLQGMDKLINAKDKVMQFLIKPEPEDAEDEI